MENKLLTDIYFDHFAEGRYKTEDTWTIKTPLKDTIIITKNHRDKGYNYELRKDSGEVYKGFIVKEKEFKDVLEKFI